MGSGNENGFTLQRHEVTLHDIKPVTSEGKRGLSSEHFFIYPFLLLNKYAIFVNW